MAEDERQRGGQGKPPTLGRMLKTQGQLRVRALGRRKTLVDFYHAMLRATWPQLFAMFALSFVGFNLLFAFLYELQPGGVDWGQRPIAGPPFWRDFVFSVDTMATVGYGNMVPITGYANLVAVAEIALGMLYVALITGIAFARFSRPTALILFSRPMVVNDIGGQPKLMFRAANQRHNLIFEASASMSLLIDTKLDGRPMRRFSDLHLVREANPVFALTWTIIHPIDQDSPLAPYLEAKRLPPGSELIVVLSGTDDRTGQIIHGRWAYNADDILWGYRFVDILGVAEDGIRTIDYNRFHDAEPVARDVAPADGSGPPGGKAQATAA
ncbi:ion channel [Sphingomonas ginkgonis]|nr:ion channel [Sphingomonas ginkgonis]